MSWHLHTKRHKEKERRRQLNTRTHTQTERERELKNHKQGSIQSDRHPRSSQVVEITSTFTRNNRDGPWTLTRTLFSGCKKVAQSLLEKFLCFITAVGSDKGNDVASSGAAFDCSSKDPQFKSYFFLLLTLFNTRGRERKIPRWLATSRKVEFGFSILQNN